MSEGKSEMYFSKANTILFAQGQVVKRSGQSESLNQSQVLLLAAATAAAVAKE